MGKRVQNSPDLGYDEWGARWEDNDLLVRQPDLEDINNPKPVEIRVKGTSGDDPIYRLPPMKKEAVFVGLSQTTDWGLELFGIPSLWKSSRGAGVKVAVLDTGVDLGHPDLVDNILDAKDFTESRSGPQDEQGHGTHVAGIVAAIDNSLGVVGVAPESKLLIGKVLGPGGGTGRQVANAIMWAVEQGAQIISMSIGTPLPDQRVYEALKGAIQKGVLVITAAGNDGPSLDTVLYPAKFPETITVGSIDRQKKISRFSSRGRQVDIVAPGDRILSTYPVRGYAEISGTSMACPFVAGAVALMLGSDVKLNQSSLIKTLRESALDVGESGFDPNYGYGLLNPEALLPRSQIPEIFVRREDLSASGQAKLNQYISGQVRGKLVLQDGRQAEIVFDIEASGGQFELLSDPTSLRIDNPFNAR